MAEIFNGNMIEKMKEAFGLKQRTINKVAEWVQPVMVCNDEDNPIAIHVHNTPVPFVPRGTYTVNTTNNKGGFSTTTRNVTPFALTNSQNSQTATLRTVTAGSKFYATALYVSIQAASVTEFLLKDNGSGGTTKFVGLLDGNAASRAVIQIAFPTPIEFDTDVFIDYGTASPNSGRCVVVGFEVDND